MSGGFDVPVHWLDMEWLWQQWDALVVSVLGGLAAHYLARLFDKRVLPVAFQLRRRFPSTVVRTALSVGRAARAWLGKFVVVGTLFSHPHGRLA